MDDLTVNKLQFSRLPLFGRDREIEVLEEALDRLVGNDEESNNAVRILNLIYGNSGSGKTALANQAEAYVRRHKKGLFISGKFDLKQMDKPYAAVENALVQLCEETSS